MNKNSHPKFTKVLFSSIEPFRNSSDLFPSHDRRIGISVSCGYHPEEKCVMVLVEEERPSFLSTSLGEYITPDKSESFLRQSAAEIAKSCRRVANELLDHAERMERLAKSSVPLINPTQIDSDKDHEIQPASSPKFIQQTYPKSTIRSRHAQSMPSTTPEGLNLDDI